MLMGNSPNTFSGMYAWESGNEITDKATSQSSSYAIHGGPTSCSGSKKKRNSKKHQQQQQQPQQQAAILSSSPTTSNQAVPPTQVDYFPNPYQHINPWTPQEQDKVITNYQNHWGRQEEEAAVASILDDLIRDDTIEPQQEPLQEPQ
ncbi:hypothetical protein OS493_035542 [Desmophyllum pertusum]|uniref:Uncharacterized protein n=1 Tax=Desmophyllum pertusum TaxID=174260 RepID=A0A9X0CE86_9CNID|nr:hypothetical protein OS493_035542 [Desmophyllum pertusum]